MSISKTVFFRLKAKGSPFGRPERSTLGVAMIFPQAQRYKPLAVVHYSGMACSSTW